MDADKKLSRLPASMCTTRSLTSKLTCKVIARPPAVREERRGKAPSQSLCVFTQITSITKRSLALSASASIRVHPRSNPRPHGVSICTRSTRTSSPADALCPALFETVPADFRAVAAVAHITPAAAVVLGGVDEQPATSIARALAEMT